MDDAMLLKDGIPNVPDAIQEPQGITSGVQLDDGNNVVIMAGQVTDHSYAPMPEVSTLSGLPVTQEAAGHDYFYDKETSLMAPEGEVQRAASLKSEEEPTTQEAKTSSKNDSSPIEIDTEVAAELSMETPGDEESGSGGKEEDVYEESDEPRPFPCDQCSVAFVDRLQLATHERMHGEDAPLPCRECGRVFYLPLALSRHQRVHLPRPPPSQETGRRRRRQRSGKVAEVSVPTVTCGGCEDEFDEQEMREHHVGYHWCSLCQKVFGLFCQLKRHSCAGKRRASRVKRERYSPEPPPPRQRSRQPQVRSKGRKRSAVEEIATPPKKRPRPGKQPEPMILKTDIVSDEGDGMKDEFPTGEEEPSGDEAAKISDQSKETLTCDHCSMKFGNISNLRRHVTAKHSGVMYECEAGDSEAPKESTSARSTTCGECKVKFSTYSNMRRHWFSKHGNQPFQCETCLMTFSAAAGLTTHSRERHREKPIHRCPVCPRMFTQRAIVQHHVRRAHAQPSAAAALRADVEVTPGKAAPENPRERLGSEQGREGSPGTRERPSRPARNLRCDICHLQFANHSGMLRHKANQHGNQKFQCEVCEDTFKGMDILVTHTVKAHHQKRVYPCSQCALFFTQQRIVEYHKVRAHSKKRIIRNEADGERDHSFDEPRITLEKVKDGEEPEQDGGGESQLDPLRRPIRGRWCERCGLQFNTALAMRKHWTAEHRGQEMFKCEGCSSAFHSLNQLILHSLEDHKQVALYPCPKCSRYFAQKCIVKYHMDQNHGEFVTSKLLSAYSDKDKGITCVECGESFRDETSLLAHLGTSSGASGDQGTQPQTLKCPGPGTRQPQGAAAKTNLCHLCGRAFRARSAMVRHVRFHSNARPHVCEHCGKGFKAATTLKEHVRIHTGERPYPCPVCFKRFRQHQQLQTHMKTHRSVREASTARVHMVSEDGPSFKEKWFGTLKEGAEGLVRGSVSSEDNREITREMSENFRVVQ